MSDLKDYIISAYFSDPDHMIDLKEGQVLLHQNEINHRLFFIVEGVLQGFLPDEDIKDPVLEENAGGFIGVYSFFSKDHKSYTEVRAAKRSRVAYFNGDPFKLPGDEGVKFTKFLFSVVVEELRSRQHFAGHMARERHKSMTKLLQSEKMIVLGQLSMGLAHELNNAVGAFSSNLDQLTRSLTDYFKSHESEFVTPYFFEGLREGQTKSTKELREERSDYEQLGLNKSATRRIAKTGLDPVMLKAVINDDEQFGTQLSFLWEMGSTLHDMEVSSRQAAHVVQSVKQMGVANQRWSYTVDVNKTISEALAILKGISKEVAIETRFEQELPSIYACSGELIQIWVNLVKNAIESLNAFNQDTRKVMITTQLDGVSIAVNIEDNGPGIPKEVWEKIFQPSFSTKVAGLSFGLGLGLTIVKRIIEEHGGEIKVTSQPGQTVFSVFLPIETQPKE
ncbi:MAG: GHKL domain-containing protein [Cyclobacteriaceae bacterium]|nr:GHKL domain-containing protein [Cyclobacteriaceae bacterium HetDA_MAG_MS6]